jgi:hypothetical protein
MGMIFVFARGATIQSWNTMKLGACVRTDSRSIHKPNQMYRNSSCVVVRGSKQGLGSLNRYK